MSILRYHSFIFLFFIGQATSWGQGAFNLPIDLGYPLNHFRDMIVDKDTIFGYGLGFSNDSIPQQGLLLSKFDTSGNHLYSRMILDPEGEPLSIAYHWGKIASTLDNGYIMTAASNQGKTTW